MHLTTHTDYALRVLIYLALAGERRGTAGDIARAYGISVNHLMKVCHHLAHGGWVEAKRGRNGGLRLRHSPEDIVIGQVIRDMESGFELVACQGDRCTCTIASHCRLRDMVGRALEAFLGELDRYTLSDLLAADLSAGLERRLFTE